MMGGEYRYFEFDVDFRGGKGIFRGIDISVLICTSLSHSPCTSPYTKPQVCFGINEGSVKSLGRV